MAALALDMPYSNAHTVITVIFVRLLTIVARPQACPSAYGKPSKFACDSQLGHRVHLQLSTENENAASYIFAMQSIRTMDDR